MNCEFPGVRENLIFVLLIDVMCSSSQKDNIRKMESPENQGVIVGSRLKSTTPVTSGDSVNYHQNQAKTSCNRQATDYTTMSVSNNYDMSLCDTSAYNG